MEADFSGWATKNDIECSDGTTIKKDAFIENDGKKVPIAFAHDEWSLNGILGYAKLSNRDEGVYFDGYLNNTRAGKTAKELLSHGDIDSVSIAASVDSMNKKGEILHGDIMEVSLVVAGANPGAKIETVSINHEDGGTRKVRVFTGETILVPEDMTADEILDAAGLEREEPPKPPEEPEGEALEDEEESPDENDNTDDESTTPLTEEDAKKSNLNHFRLTKKGDKKMPKRNIFENAKATEKFSITKEKLQEFGKVVIEDAKETGSLKKAIIRHADDYGIKNIDVLFPDAQAVRTTPDFVQREDAWVQVVLNGTSHSPFARIKSLTADITADEARAKGYIKGNQKVAEFFSVAQRTTTPTTIYKLQKLDRDDVIDITSFDVVAWILSEMRIMLDEEIARAILIGDGRTAGSADKIKEENVRPIYNDADLYTVKSDISATTWNDAIEEIAKSKVKYKGTGTPTFFTTAAVHANMLWAKDTNGRRLYDTDETLAAALGVSQIVEVEEMEKLTLNSKNVLGVYVSLTDYTIGTDKGGDITSFDDFDIDFNQYKYLLETRISGALTRPYSAVTITSATLDNTSVSTTSTASGN